ncbi:serine/threonine kinase family protein [Plesiocystis pacifica SIR-1]|uniref:Serine/threonine kinase family protein n=1 Tax=Plesiocystis pacifica SIR-1 TaxID=391625 RepID=A6G7H1_9BACT|nr:serine/threonine-protein kinase [Plesiocystis pacifica]EDM78180.1 serine/threonine kinase family protein [Plesiocystis pacifica SIR-1]
MSSLETTVTIDSSTARGTQPTPGIIDGQSLPNVAGKLDKFSILRKIGAGGMGEVYAAYDDHLGRKVAIKLLHADLGIYNSRFTREAQGLARLNHPNVVQVYELGVFRGKLFIVMEFVAGVTLKHWIRAQRHTRPEILEVFIAAGRGLAAAHDANLVHRDFKPDNVMVGNDGRVRVMDFGLVHEDGESDDEPEFETSDHGERIELSRARSALNVELTTPGSLLGTPAYMAPEQHLGLATDARSDQFSFCVTLWEALYGSRPFKGDTLAEIVESVTKHQLAEPPRSADVPTWLRAVVERGLAHEPDERWPSMAELLAALEQDPTRRRRWLLTGVGSVALAALGVFANHLRVENKRETARSEIAAATEEREARCAAEAGTIDEVWNQRARETIRGALLATEHRSAESVWELTGPSLDEYAAAWATTRGEVCLTGALERELGSGARDLYRRAAMDLPEPPLPLSSEQAELARICLDERQVALTSLVTALESTQDAGGVLLALNAVAKLPSITDCVDPVVLASSVRLPSDPAIHSEVTKLRQRIVAIESHHSIGDNESARAEAEAVLADAQRVGFEPLTAEAHYWVGWLDLKLGNLERAAEHLEDALFLGGRSHEPVTLRAASSLVFLHTEHKRDYDAALRWGRLGQLFADLTEAHDGLAEAKLLSDIGTVYSKQQEQDQSIEYFTKALQIYESRLPPGHPDLALILNNLGMDHYQREDYDNALNYHRRALDLRQQSLPPGHSDIGVTRYNLGLVYERQKAHTLAVESYTAALDIWEAGYANQRGTIALIANSLGRAQLAAGSLDEAEKQLERALELRLAADANTLPRDRAETRYLLAQVRWKQDDREGARALALAAHGDFRGTKLERADPETRRIAEAIEVWLEARDLLPAEPAPATPGADAEDAEAAGSEAGSGDAG